MKKVGIIGCGAIGTLIARAVEDQVVKCDGLILYDNNIEKSNALKKSLHVPVTVAKDVGEMIRQDPKVIVEAASQEAARKYMARILNENIDLIVMSVGALLDSNLRSNRIHVPSGAIGGLDAISSASLAGIEEITLTTSKSPAVLGMNNREKKTVYEGPAEDAVLRFPREMNVAATLALTAKPAKVRVRVISDPESDKNIHEIEVRWKYGKMSMRFLNDPHPENPKTSALAAWSAIRLLKEILQAST